MPVCRQGFTLTQTQGLTYPPQPRYISLEVPRKEASLQDPLTEPLHRERCSTSRALLTYLSKSPEKNPPLQVPLTEPVHRERSSVSRALFTHLPNFPEKEPPSRFPSQSPPDTDAPFPEPPSTCLSKATPNHPPPPSRFPIGAPMERCSSPGPSKLNKNRIWREWYLELCSRHLLRQVFPLPFHLNTETVLFAETLPFSLAQRTISKVSGMLPYSCRQNALSWKQVA
jgi:hypothetical protein